MSTNAVTVAFFGSVASLAWSAAYAWTQWLKHRHDGGRDGVQRPDLDQSRLARLEQAFPATLNWAELVTSPGQAPGGDAENETRIRQAVLAMILAGRASISAVPVKVGSATDDRPKAWFVAQVEAASGQPWMTNLCHVGVPVHPVLTALLPHLDGTHCRAELQARLAAALRSFAIVVPELPADLPQPSQERLDAIAERYVQWALDHLARHAFLEAV